MPPALDAALKAAGVDRFFRHQAHAIDLVRHGQHVVVATGTASGKTASRTVTLDQGVAYLILFHTDGAEFTMVSPTITVTAT